MKRTGFRETDGEKMTQVTQSQSQGLSDCSKFPSMSRQRSRSKSQSKTSCAFSREDNNPEDPKRPVLNVEPKICFLWPGHTSFKCSARLTRCKPSCLAACRNPGGYLHREFQTKARSKSTFKGLPPSEHSILNGFDLLKA